MKFYRYSFALILSFLPLLCLSIPIENAGQSVKTYHAIEELSDSFDQTIHFDDLEIKQPAINQNLLQQATQNYTKGLNPLATEAQPKRKSNKKSRKKKTEQELFDEFLATDALTGELTSRKKRSAFSIATSASSDDKGQTSRNTGKPEKSTAPNNKFDNLFKEQFASNQELYNAFQQGKDYLSEQKHRGYNVLKQYNIEFSSPEGKRTGILEEAAKNRKNTDQSFDHSVIENSFLMRVINFATSWKGITLAAVLGFFYILFTALINSRSQ